LDEQELSKKITAIAPIRFDIRIFIISNHWGQTPLSTPLLSIRALVSGQLMLTPIFIVDTLQPAA